MRRLALALASLFALLAFRVRHRTTYLSMGPKLAFCLGKGHPERVGYTFTDP